MIKIFRNIRRELLTLNKLNKYLLYAIGEILLVVIGILIALQLDNWNDTQKDRTAEVKILREILGNLEHDLVEIRSDIASMDSVNKASVDVARFLQSDSLPAEKFYYDVAKLRVNPHFDPNKSGYNLLVSKGVEIILNDRLREAISQLYESLYAYYYRYEEERTQFKLQSVNPFLLKYFNWHPRPDLAFFGHYKINPEDYMRLKVDASFPKLLNAVSFDNTLVQNRAHRVESGIASLIADIETELREKGIGLEN